MIVPIAFDAIGNATTFVLSVTSERRWSRSTRHSESSSASFTTTPLSCAISSHGAMFASWSSFVATTSSPAAQSRDAARESAKFSDVMFAPNVTSSVITPSRSDAAARADVITSSVTIDVRNLPPAFAFAASRYPETASRTESGTCVPAGPSKYASGTFRAWKRSRTASIVTSTICSPS